MLTPTLVLLSALIGGILGMTVAARWSPYMTFEFKPIRIDIYHHLVMDDEEALAKLKALESRVQKDTDKLRVISEEST